MKNEETTYGYLRAVMENAFSATLLAKEVGVEMNTGQLVDSCLPEIENIIARSLPLARLLDESDILVHAEGPGAEHALPWLTSINWVTATINKSIRNVFFSYFEGAGATNSKQISRDLDLRVTGFAPGSIWMGTKVVLPKMSLDFSVDESFVKDTLSALPRLANYIGDERLLPEIYDLEMDPAQRDFSLETLLLLSPSGQMGIHTMEISTKSDGAARLSQRERVVLREALKNPLGKKRQRASFTGSIRAADLDKSRVSLRTPDGVIRCAFAALSTDEARSFLGKSVRVSGEYEADRSGRPRMMVVEQIVPVPETENLI